MVKSGGTLQNFFLIRSKKLTSPWGELAWVMAFSSCYQRVHSMFVPSGRRLVLSVTASVGLTAFARNTQQILERKDVSVTTTELEEKTFCIGILLPELS